MKIIWKEHSGSAWITNVHMQRGGLRELVTGSRDGVVKLWDVRMLDSLDTIVVTPPGGKLRSLSVHEHVPILAA